MTTVLCQWAGCSVGIATDYVLDGPRSSPGGDEIFRPSRPALGPTQPHVKWVPVLSRGKVRPGRAADHSPPSSAAVLEEYSYTSTHPLGHSGPVAGSLYFTFTFLYQPHLRCLAHSVPQFLSVFHRRKRSNSTFLYGTF